ncbi:MAG TPA: DUF1801 domain-containing protein [Candidatus Bathyarchaeia archaeon]|nr:DUF1801 domain-containing protein [Candidatus Bathyarchaeia archaeon]
MKSQGAPRTIDEYLEAFPEDIRRRLQELRAAIAAAAPEARERISYRMPAFDLDGVLVYFAAFKDHISLFPTASGVQAFRRELAPYRVSKGTVHFPLDRPLPLKLVARIVKFRAAENRRKRAAKARPAV